jgi:RNA polymerase sigma-70 factor (ECF subfamily)
VDPVGPGGPDPADGELVSLLAAGDRTALAELYRRHAPWLVVRLTRRCADPAVVDDVLQDTFVAVWRGAARWDGRGDVAAWIWGIGIRRLLDALRHRRSATVSWLPVHEQGLRAEDSAEERVLLGVEYGDLGPALDRLSPELRAVVQATVLDGLTTREAGRLLGIPAGTVKTRMMRAKAQLRESLA